MADVPESGGPPDAELDPSLLDRFLTGECSPAEVELVRRWLAAHPASAQYVNDVRAALEKAARPAGGWDTAGAWARVLRDAVAPERNAARLPPPLRLTASTFTERRALARVIASPWMRLAAAIVLVIGAGALWLGRAPTWFGTPPRSAVPPMHEYVTARGQRTELRLPDGTRVMLAPDSRLRVPADFDAAGREVALEGQAYFAVIHDERKPFQVRVGTAVVHDLGTEFVVRAYTGARTVQVVVAEGKVELRRAAEGPSSGGAVLGRGESGRLDAAGGITTGRADLAAALAWTQGRLVFNETPLRDVIPELARWYDLDIRLADSALGHRRVTLSLGPESATAAVEAVALLADARYERSGRVVTFSSKAAAP